MVRVSARAAITTAALLLAAITTTAAQDYPVRPITMVVPYPAGALTDAGARLPRDAMSAALGQPVVIENRPGAGGTTGAAFVANAAPDGYTLLTTVSAPMTLNRFLQKNFPYDPLTAFAPVSLVAESYLLFAVHPSLPVQTMAEFIDYARKNPGKLAYGTSGIGSAHHIAGELLKRKTGIDMVHVPYKGGAPSMQDLIAGNIPVAFATPPAALPQAQAGRIRVLATTRAERIPDLPDVPTIAETVPGVVTMSWIGLFAPAATPNPIVDRLNVAVAKAIADPNVIAAFKLQGLAAKSSTPLELRGRVKSEIELWGPIVSSLGIAVE
jgi:tripartite-type tricarboxylate transporter receptor subunit TctC